MMVRAPLRDIRSAHVFFPIEKLQSAQTTEIAFSSVKSVQVDSKWRLLDSVSNLTKDTVRELAVRLKSADPSTFGLLTCLGAVHDEKNNDFSLVFRIPDGLSEPTTLRARIMACDTAHSLSDRFRLATQLARAVSSVHTFDMVHKSIRPENIILFRDQDSALGSAFLLGFERVRRQADSTRLGGDTDWEKNIYRHPERQGSTIRRMFLPDTFQPDKCCAACRSRALLVNLSEDVTAIDEVVIVSEWHSGRARGLGRGQSKAAGYQKIKFCAEKASLDQLQYFWIDTCCIDKWNLLELSKSINSMFRWYQNATKCYVFLSDVSASTATDANQQSTWETSFRSSKWFTRGWTLQELIALQAASSGGHEKVVQMLLDRGAEVNAQGGEYRLTPLYEAALNGHLAVVKLLLNRGADVSIASERGWTPLHAAV
ncbi:hypothetical protein EPUS_09092 [Endocarpon pusillum Z07020]|uniref:Heterokaryon incompatibility domain-containing protein n=1 Tax=Endocarpon pusillum (strain Z07020 / HMAS-L-300199) TaxID=1263415 RepID=U1GSB5_ENDPU|nr:uncharacterized protein EPUS_09092 [Endocarpon pusillum Z07020]ERF74886.1 hypothetical protein EPUS_09092 [Endocarpon pusillum Z07020]